MKSTGEKHSLLTADDLYLFNEGSHFHLYDKLGAHPATLQGVEGTHFAVWAPEAEQVSVFGTFNHWDPARHPLHPCQFSGIWEGFVPGVGVGALYKFHIRSRHHGAVLIKTDPFARLNEIPPKSASVVWNLDYTWQDSNWMHTRARHNALDAPISIDQREHNEFMKDGWVYRFKLREDASASDKVFYTFTNWAGGGCCHAFLTRIMARKAKSEGTFKPFSFSQA